MGITVSVLEGMTPSALDYTQANLDAAGKWFGDADDSFTAQAVTPVETGAAWSGDGQPDAVTVLGINGSAMQNGILAMEAAGNAVSGLRLAMEKARNVVVAEIAAKPPHMRVHDNGFVTVDVAALDQRVTPLVPEMKKAELSSRRVIGALLYATAADASYAGLFSGIGNHLPTYTDVADPGALAHNIRQLQNVVSDVNVSNDLLRFWEEQQPPVLSQQDFNYLVSGPPHGDVPFLEILDVATTIFGFIPLVRGANLTVKGIEFLNRIWRPREGAPSPPKEPEVPAPPKEAETAPKSGEETSGGRPEVIDPHTGEKVDVDAISTDIAAGHAYEKHVVTRGEFPGVRTRGELADVVRDVISTGAQKQLPNDRVAYWRGDVIVVTNPRDPDAGTVFAPKDGKAYFDLL